MLLAFEETVWSKKYFYWWTVRLHLNFYVHKNLKIFMHICLAKISLWSVWRDLREAKCGFLVVNYMKIFKFWWLSIKRLKCWGVSCQFQNAFGFWAVWSKKYFYWWTVRLHLNFYVHKNLKFSCTLAKISLWSVWRDLREANKKNLKCSSNGFQRFFKAFGDLKIFLLMNGSSTKIWLLKKSKKWRDYWWTVRLHLKTMSRIEERFKT